MVVEENKKHDEMKNKTEQKKQTSNQKNNVNKISNNTPKKSSPQNNSKQNNKQKNSNKRNNNNKENGVNKSNQPAQKNNINTSKKNQDNSEKNNINPNKAKTNTQKENNSTNKQASKTPDNTPNIISDKEKIKKANELKIEQKNDKDEAKKEETIDKVLKNRDYNKEKISLQNEILENEKSKEKEQKYEPIKDIKSNKNNSEKKSKPIFKVTIIFIIILLIALISSFIIFTIINNKPTKIAKGIYIDSVDVSEMTKDAAKIKLEEYYTEKLSHDITLTHNEYEAFINPSEISLRYDINSAVNSAFDIGKNGNIFEDNYEILNAILNGVSITPKYNYNIDTLKSTLSNYSNDLPDHVVEHSYYIEDKNLIITLGSSGNAVDIENTVSLIEDTFSDLSFVNKKIEIKTISKDPSKLDISKIHSEIYKEAKDAYYTTNPYVVYPSENGLDFKISIEDAEELVANSNENEINIPLKILYPNVTTNMIGSEAFPDLLGTYSTKYVSNKDRTTNLSLAAGKINGYVLLPGETFSYNTVVGERTIAAGYKSAAVYENGQVVQGLGGGICQISTTLFNAVLFANLGIVELHNHQFVPSYVTAGRDATVVYGIKDFKFKNTRNYAIKIECSVSGGIAKFNIWGVKEPTEYDVSVYANVTSKTDTYIKSATYRTLKLNGQVVNTEKIANYTYKVH